MERSQRVDFNDVKKTKIGPTVQKLLLAFLKWSWTLRWTFFCLDFAKTLRGGSNTRWSSSRCSDCRWARTRSVQRRDTTATTCTPCPTTTAPWTADTTPRTASARMLKSKSKIYLFPLLAKMKFVPNNGFFSGGPFFSPYIHANLFLKFLQQL